MNIRFGGGATGAFRLYGDLLLLLGKSRQKPLAPTYGPALRTGFPRCGVLRGFAASGWVRQPPSRDFGYAEGRYAPAPTDTSARPADGTQVTGGAWAGVVSFSGFCGELFGPFAGKSERRTAAAIYPRTGQSAVYRQRALRSVRLIRRSPILGYTPGLIGITP